MTVDAPNDDMVAGSWRELRKVSSDNELKARRSPSSPARHGVTPVLIASEDDIAAIASKLGEILKRLR